MARKTPWHQTLSQLVSEHRAPPGGRPSLSPKPRTLAKAGLSLLAIALVATLSAGILFFWQSSNAEAQDAPPRVSDAETHFNYNENGTGPITSYRARDPEGRKIFWTLGGTDASRFTIDGGVLRFKGSPDFENPRDRADSATVPPALANNNIYRVTVRFGAGGQNGDPDPTDDYAGDDVGELKLTITVINLDEPGMVRISSLQPQVGTQLTATVSDDDGVAVPGSWQWASSDSMNGPFTDIPLRSRDHTYRPTIDDLDKYLRVTAEYGDNAGADIKEVSAVSANRVRKDVVTSNDRPTFPDQQTLLDDTTVTRGETERFIREGSRAGTKVGAPVTAFDDMTDIDILTYSLTGGADHVKNFNIDEATGQITVAAGASLNAEAGTGSLGDAASPFRVTVIATDGDGDARTIVVTIRVVGYNEPPSIGPDPDATTPVVAAREMSHWEKDRTPRLSRRIDIDLDSGVLDYSDPAAPTLVTTNSATEGYQDATYAASDPDDAAADLKWSLAGPDAGLFFVYTNTLTGRDIVTDVSIDEDDFEDDIKEHVTDTGATAFLAFKDDPDWEKPEDANRDNVHEVTLVVTDSVGNTATYPVTVKVINSKEDNEPGKVKILNRVPEIGTKLEAVLEDDDGGLREVKWQWYRSADTATAVYPARCPAATTEDGNGRYFIDTAGTGWQKIPGAKGTGVRATYTPDYDEDAGGTVSTATPGSEIWTGGDMDLTIATTAATGDNPEFKTYTWSEPHCLRVAYTYRDAIDRTHAEPNDPATAVDETLEGAHIGAEFSVKRIDEENDAPVFTEGGAVGEPKVSRYTAERREDAPDYTDDATAGASRRIIEAHDATDVMADEDDDSSHTGPDAANPNRPLAGPGADILTYTLSGPDAKYFKITGTVDTRDTATASPVGDGILSFKDADDLKLDYETKPRYVVTITATDPSGDSASVTVTVNITNLNEKPVWAKDPGKVVYMENGTAPVGVYLARDPEGASVEYSLVAAATTIDGEDIAAPAVADSGKFEIDRLRGTLRFKSPPNYEKPGDTVTTPANNMYQVTVQAKAVDPSDLTPTTTPQPGNHVIAREVTVVVTDVNEAPVFFDTTDTLEITENPDDPEKEPPLAAGYLYLLNRGVGKPAANLPATPNLDVGIPVLANDDDSTGNFAIGGYTDTDRDRVDGLTYTLSGDTGPFHIVPATGQILTKQKLDYEAKKQYKVTVMATDPDGASDSIGLTINVVNVDEVPVSGLLTLAGNNSHTFAENDTDTDLGTYTVSGITPAVTWTVEGADASHFMLDDQDNPQGRSRMLKFASSPNYEMPRGQAKSDTNTNTYMVTVKVTADGEMKTVDVAVTVTNVEEPGMVSLSATGGKVGTPLTAMLSDDDGVMGAIEWQWYRVVNGTSHAITGARSASYTPVAADVGNLLKAMATYNDGYDNNNTASTSIETPVADANAAPEFAAATATRAVAENKASGTPVGSPVMATDPNGDVITYGVAGDDATSFTIDSATGQIMTSAMLDHEAKSSHMITVTAADPEGATGEIAVTVNVTNVDEAGMVSLSPAQPSIGTEITASVTDPDGGVGGETWRWSRSDTMDGVFTPYSAETTASITPTAADEDRYLRVMVTYNDEFGAQTLTRTTGMVVQNAAPMFASETTTRSVAENTASGMAIGDPVAATDADGNTLTYTLSGTDASHFDIGMSTGQLMTKSALDYETGKKQYMVTVMATDPYGAYDSIDVTIMVTDVDETPPGPVDPHADLIDRYDTNNNGMIEKAEVIAAINDYLFGTGDDRITKAQVIVLINRYLFGNGGS